MKNSKSKIITVDVGNTNIVFGIFENCKIILSSRISTQSNFEADQYAITIKSIIELNEIDCANVEGIIVSSVVPQVTSVVVRSFEFLFPTIKPIMFNLKTVPFVKLKIDYPEKLGTDILAGSIAAITEYPLPAIIIDMGTATKLTAISKDAEILGVSIMPGVFISFNALIARASLLGGIELEKPQAAIGKNTSESIKSGVILGTASMVDGLIDRFEKEMGKAKTIISTGGAASLVIPNCKHNIKMNPEMVLLGLYNAYMKFTEN